MYENSVPPMSCRAKRRLIAVSWATGLFWLLPLCASVSAQTSSVESLDYSVVYRGVFSAGQDLPIADLTLVTDLVAAPARTKTRLSASSAAYDVVEAAYPIRYRVDSWADAQTGHLIGFETHEKTRGIVEDKREILDSLANLLIEKEAVDREEFKKLLQLTS